MSSVTAQKEAIFNLNCSSLTIVQHGVFKISPNTTYFTSERIIRPPPMSRESTSIKALEAVREQLRKIREKSKSVNAVRASLAPYCETEHVFELINQVKQENLRYCFNIFG